MSFRDNLQHLRGTRDLSQAQLATLLGVSRQSVAKWESEKSYPEMDKLIKLCDLFECSLDDLVRGDLAGCEAPVGEAAAEAPALAAVESDGEGAAAEELALAVGKPDAGAEVVEAVEAEAEATRTPAVEPVDEFGYDEHMRRRAWDIAAGVAVIVLSFGVDLFVTVGHSYRVSSSAMVYGIAIAIALFFMVSAHRSHAAFRKEHPVVEDFYKPAQKAEARRRKACGLVAGIAFAVLGFCSPAILGFFYLYGPFPSLAVFSCFAAAAFLLVHSVLMDRRVDVSFYNGARDLTIQSFLRGRRTDA